MLPIYFEKKLHVFIFICLTDNYQITYLSIAEKKRNCEQIYFKSLKICVGSIMVSIAAFQSLKIKFFKKSTTFFHTTL